MLARRLNLQTKMSMADIQTHRGWQHTNFGRGLTIESAKEYNNSHAHKVSDCSNFINSVT